MFKCQIKSQLHFKVKLLSVLIKIPALQGQKIIKMNIDILTKAVENGEIEKVQDLLQKNKYPENAKSQSFEIALSREKQEVAKLLINNGLDVNCRMEARFGTFTPLHCAIINNCQEILEILLKKGADINGTDDFNNPPIHYAIEIKNIDAIECLLKNSADLSFKNHKQQTALDLAKETQSLEIIELVVDKIIETKEAENELNPPNAKRFKLEDCVICCNPRNEIFVFHPCGHAKTCESCTLKIMYISDVGSNCPVCRQKVDSHVKAFI